MVITQTNDSFVILLVGQCDKETLYISSH